MRLNPSDLADLKKADVILMMLLARLNLNFRELWVLEVLNCLLKTSPVLNAPSLLPTDVDRLEYLSMCLRPDMCPLDSGELGSNELSQD